MKDSNGGLFNKIVSNSYLENKINYVEASKLLNCSVKKYERTPSTKKYVMDTNALIGFSIWNPITLNRNFWDSLEQALVDGSGFTDGCC